jgi:hypothetical protein
MEPALSYMWHCNGCKTWSHQTAQPPQPHLIDASKGITCAGTWVRWMAKQEDALFPEIADYILDKIGNSPTLTKLWLSGEEGKVKAVLYARSQLAAAGP